MDAISRRNFIRGLSVGTVGGFLATMGISSTVFRSALVPAKESERVDIGQVKGVAVKCISETSWFNNAVQMADFRRAGGALVSQYDVNFTNEGVADGYKGANAGGYSSLVDVHLLDGSHKLMLLDTGWNVEWMTARFEAEGVDKLLKNKEIDVLFVSHDHYDHFWGIQAALQ